MRAVRENGQAAHDADPSDHHGDLGDHDGDPGDHDAPILAITMRRSKRSRWPESALWTFVRVEGDKPTNNSAERAVRHGVVVRKISGGTKSEGGSRFIERILTVRATLRLQRRTILPFILTACEARLRRTTPPSLVRVATAGPRESSPQLRIAA